MNEFLLLSMIWLLMGYASVVIVAAEFTRHGATWSYLFTRNDLMWQLGMAACGPISLTVAIVDYYRESRKLARVK